MTRSSHFALIAFVSLEAILLASTAWAQPGGGGPGGPPGGGRGGPGFGMGGGFGGGGFMMGGMGGGSVSSQFDRLLNSASVRKEVNVSDEDRTKIREATEKVNAKIRAMYAEELTKAFEETLRPEQFKRLKGIALQQAGVQALNDPQLQKELKMTDEQVAKLKAIGEDSGEKTRELFSGDVDRETIGEKMQSIREDAEKQMTALLTDDQTASLEKMMGDDFKIPPEELRGPGRGGFGGAGGRGGAGGTPRGFGGPGGNDGQRQRPAAKSEQ